MAAKDTYKYFRIEGRELVDSLQRGLLDLEKGGPGQELAAAMLRATHTLKGAARVVRLAEMADLAHQIEEALAPAREGGPSTPELLARLRHLIGSLEASLAALSAPDPAKLKPGGTSERLETVRLEIDELDEVLEGLREARGGLGSLRREIEADPERFGRRYLAMLEQAERELELAAEKAGGMRLLPASALFAYLERVARDAAEATGKTLRFVSQGGERRLDAPILSALQEALQHAVRNAVVHGIEAPAARRSAGKPPEAMLHVSLELENGRARFTCKDDGRGLDLAAVADSARSRGFLAASETGALSSDRAVELLLQGGLSTSTEVTELSGRGLGLDVLRETARRLKGSLRLRSSPGAGLELEIEVPALLSQYAVLGVEQGGITALIPFAAVSSVRKLGRDGLLAGAEALPLLSLGSCYSRPSASRVAVLLRGAGGVAALGVDRVLGVREAVVLPLPRLSPAGRLAAGASLDASGDPCLVLDPDGLIEKAHAPRPQLSEAAAVAGLPILVVDDSLTTRMLEQSILETAGYTVQLAASAEEGLALLSENRYRLLLVDVEMPGMDGFEMLERMRRDPALRSLPAIMVSSRASESDRRRGRQAGAKDYIAKGEFDQARLLARVKELAG